MIPVKDNGGQIYKYYESGNNSRADIYCATKGKDAGKWKCEIISTYSANQKILYRNGGGEIRMPN